MIAPAARRFLPDPLMQSGASLKQTTLDLADANLLQSIREYAAWQFPHELLEQDGLLMLAGASDFPGAVRNCVARVDPAVTPAELLDRANDFFASAASRCT
jgi:hypothetical protein